MAYLTPANPATQEVFSSPSLGHNGGPSLSVPASEMVLPDDHKKLFHFAKWHIDDYIAGTMGMSPEQEGIYIRFLMRLYQRGKPLPDDDRFMALIMNLSTRVWRRVCDSLIAIGKILRKNGALTNSRFERERERRAAELQKQADSAKARWQRERHLAKVSAELAANLAETSTKISESEEKKVNKINETPVTTHMPLKSPETKRPDKDTTLDWRAKGGHDKLASKLLDACNGAAANPAVAPGILVLSEPIKWLEAGCDLDLDILPTITARAHKMRPGSIKNWSYFTQAVADAKAAREAPMPDGNAPPDGRKPNKPQGNYSFSGEYIGRRL